MLSSGYNTNRREQVRKNIRSERARRQFLDAPAVEAAPLREPTPPVKIEPARIGCTDFRKPSGPLP